MDRIDAIRRTEVEGASSADSVTAPISNDPKALYSTYPFEIHFVCDTDSLRNVLNSLEQADYLFIIRSLTINSVAIKVRGSRAGPGGGDNPRPRLCSEAGKKSCGHRREPVHVEAPLLDARRLNVSDAIGFCRVHSRKNRKPVRTDSLWISSKNILKKSCWPSPS